MESPQERYAKLRLRERPEVTLRRLAAEMCALQEKAALAGVAARAKLSHCELASRIVAKQYRITVDDLRGKSNRVWLVRARDELTRLLHRDWHVPQSVIADYLGRDRANICRAVKRAENHNARVVASRCVQDVAAEGK
jgi:chromosomal replication initiation ATPase DnaA